MPVRRAAYEKGGPVCGRHDVIPGRASNVAAGLTHEPRKRRLTEGHVMQTLRWCFETQRWFRAGELGDDMCSECFDLGIQAGRDGGRGAGHLGAGGPAVRWCCGADRGRWRRSAASVRPAVACGLRPGGQPFSDSQLPGPGSRRGLRLMPCCDAVRQSLRITVPQAATLRVTPSAAAGVVCYARSRAGWLLRISAWPAGVGFRGGCCFAAPQRRRFQGQG